MELNLADLFERVADTVGHREALVSADRRLTYALLDERSTRLAHGLAGLGVRRGDHVGLYLYNGAEFVETMLACFKLRAVPVNVNYRYVGEELAHVCSDADLVALVHHRELAPRIASLPSRPGALGWFIEVDTSGADRTDLGATPYEELLASGLVHRNFGPRSADDRYVLYTGGTTGLPKGVVWRQEDILFATLGGGNPGGPPIERPEEIGERALVNRSQRIAPFLPPGDPGPDEFVALSLGPLIHASGQWTALSTMLGGGKLVLYTHRSMDMWRVLELVEAERVTMLTIVGDTSGRPLVEALEARPGVYDTSSLRLLGSGGSILTAAIKDRLLSSLPSVLAISEAVGSSEAPVQATAIATKGSPTSSLNFAARDVTIVVDDDLRPVAPGSGEIGRLATRGRGPIGYHKDPARTARTFVEIDGVRWSLPGDMATVEADGTIRLLGRGSMCINTGGEKVYPEEVEAVIKAHPHVADAVVVGADDPQWGQRVVCVVQPTRDGTPALEDLQAHCRAHLAGYKAPRALYLVDEVRRSPAGKPDYRWASGVVGAALTGPSPPRRASRGPTARTDRESTTFPGWNAGAVQSAEQTAVIRGWIEAATRVVVLTGAGISTDSGIPDFRGPQGVWTKNPGAERRASIHNYLEDAEVRRRSWQDRLSSPAWEAEPNAGHRALVALERRGKLDTLITQNIDGLHQRAGSDPERVVEIHGTIHWSVCMSCGDRRPMPEVLDRVKAGDPDPACLAADGATACGGILKSATISFGQSLVPEDLARAERAASSCDLLLAVGSSLTVFPAAGLAPLARQAGARLVIVNAEPTPYDDVADAVLTEPIGEVLPAIVG